MSETKHLAATDPNSTGLMKVVPDNAAPALEAYLLSVTGFEAALALQRALAFDVAGDRDRTCLVLCEHPPLVTVGREGSRIDLRFEVGARDGGLAVRWVNRGGGCVLHLPGQLAVYAVVPLDRMGLTLPAYLARLSGVLLDVLDDFGIPGRLSSGRPGVFVGTRPIACLGVAVRDWVSYFGAVLNVSPDLLPFRRVRCADCDEPMTSLVRERRGAVRPSLVRERLVEHFAARFRLPRTSLFFDSPVANRKAQADALAARA